MKSKVMNEMFLWRFGDLENDVHLNLSYRTLNIKSHGSFGGLSLQQAGEGNQVFGLFLSY